MCTVARLACTAPQQYLPRYGYTCYGYLLTKACSRTHAAPTCALSWRPTSSTRCPGSGLASSRRSADLDHGHTTLATPTITTPTITTPTLGTPTITTLYSALCRWRSVRTRCLPPSPPPRGYCCAASASASTPLAASTWATHRPTARRPHPHPHPHPHAHPHPHPRPHPIQNRRPGGVTLTRTLALTLSPTKALGQAARAAGMKSIGVL